MNILGVKITSHDTGAALISDERVVAIAEERLNRVKHSPDMFPHLSIAYCLNTLGIDCQNVDLIVIDQVGLRSDVDMKKLFLERSQLSFTNAEIVVINHHDAHAAAAMFSSPFKDAAILIYDGSGEHFKTHYGIIAAETETLYVGHDNSFSPIQKTTHLRNKKHFPYTFGIGKLYGFFSDSYLGFGPYNEGKMMGLASYGNDSILKKIPLERWVSEKDGHILCNSRIMFPSRPLKKRIKKINRIIPYVVSRLKHIQSNISRKLLLFLGSGIFTEPDFFDPIYLKRPKRSDEVLPDTYYSSIAYTGQYILEHVAIKWGEKLKNITGLENLCVAGGVGLNIDANRNFLEKVGFKEIFIHPGASDTGVPLGSALYGWHVIKKQPRFFNMKNAALGREYSNEEIVEELKKGTEMISYKYSDEIPNETARLIQEGNIIAWFQGGSEYGPRALGNRSILCDAGIPEMKSKLNQRVKNREMWRPFAASILREQVSDYFDMDEESPFMLLAAKVQKDKQAEVPSIVHVDETCRIQTVTKEANGIYFDLIESFKKRTGRPLLLNTSFNLGGDPIVETPKDALDSFLRTNIDYLIIGNYIVKKRVGTKS